MYGLSQRLFATGSKEAAVEVSPPSHGTKPLPESFSSVQGLNQRLRKELAASQHSDADPCAAPLHPAALRRPRCHGLRTDRFDGAR